jgi:hypothetical protein
MKYLDFDRLAELDGPAFRAQQPYPWVNAPSLLTDEGYAALRDNMPDVSGFQKVFGKQRKFGQQSHDRYSLEWEPGLELPAPWQEFVEEIRGPRYHAWLADMMGTSRFAVRMHWHYTPRGCSVSPHCDSKHKLGSHIFYFNDEKDWDPTWGGETLVLDDGGRFDSKSSPDFEDFDTAVGSESIGNWSLLFVRRGDSWHGVREIRCPEGKMRKVLIVVIEKASAWQAVKRRIAPGLAASY